MASKIKRFCKYLSCTNLVAEGYCEIHKKEKNSKYKNRSSANERGYTYRWQKARETFLKSHPLCTRCEDENRLTPATVVDHIEPHKGNHEKFWDYKNWQSLCKLCHDRKTAKEDGGFGMG